MNPPFLKFFLPEPSYDAEALRAKHSCDQKEPPNILIGFLQFASPEACLDSLFKQRIAFKGIKYGYVI